MGVGWGWVGLGSRGGKGGGRVGWIGVVRGRWGRLEVREGGKW